MWAAVSVFLLLHGGQVVSQFWHWKLVTKGLCTFSEFYRFFFFSSLVPLVLTCLILEDGLIAAVVHHVLAQGSASPASAQSSLFSWTSWCISVLGKTRRYSQGNYWYQTGVLLDIAQHCWRGSTIVGRFLFARASSYIRVDGNKALGLNLGAVYSFHLRHPLFFFFFPWNSNSSLLFLKFSIHQSTYY